MYFRYRNYYEKGMRTRLMIAFIIIGFITLPQQGAILMLIGIVGLAMVLLTAPKEKNIKKLCEEEIESFKEKVMGELGLSDEDVQVLDSTSYFYPVRNGISNKTRIKKRKDKVLESSDYEGIILFLTEEKVCSSIYEFSLTSSQKLEEFGEYLYEDIVNINTKSTVSASSKNGGIETKITILEITTVYGLELKARIDESEKTKELIKEMKRLVEENKN